MSAFFAMGGYATFVWPAYGITIAALALAIILTIRAHKAAKRALSNLEGNRP